MPGTIVYAKDGNVWLQTGDQATQLTDARQGNDSMPSFSEDGQSDLLRPDAARPTGSWRIDGEITELPARRPRR